MLAEWPNRAGSSSIEVERSGHVRRDCRGLLSWWCLAVKESWALANSRRGLSFTDDTGRGRPGDQRSHLARLLARPTLPSTSRPLPGQECREDGGRQFRQQPSSCLTRSLFRCRNSPLRKCCSTASKQQTCPPRRTSLSPNTRLVPGASFHVAEILHSQTCLAPLNSRPMAQWRMTSPYPHGAHAAAAERRRCRDGL